MTESTGPSDQNPSTRGSLKLIGVQIYTSPSSVAQVNALIQSLGLPAELTLNLEESAGYAVINWSPWKRALDALADEGDRLGQALLKSGMDTQKALQTLLNLDLPTGTLRFPGEGMTVWISYFATGEGHQDWYRHGPETTADAATTAFRAGFEALKDDKSWAYFSQGLKVVHGKYPLAPGQQVDSEGRWESHVNNS